MGGGYEFLLPLNVSCTGDCATELGPPPDSILFIPPPPMPVFIQEGIQTLITAHENDTDPHKIPCTSPCEWTIGSNGVDFVELPRQGPNLNETWFLVLITSSVGVLLLGALLALILLKCRILVLVRTCRHDKASLQIEVSATKSCEAVLYPCVGNLPPGMATPDNRVLWAALTPRGGTIHRFIPSPGVSPEYEEPVCLVNTKPQSLIGNTSSHQSSSFLYQVQSFDNSAFIGSDEPLVIATPSRVVESYLELMEAGASIKQGSPRRLVSSPTRIEHPNLPPLNLHHHHHHRSLRRVSTTTTTTTTTTMPNRRNSYDNEAVIL